MAIMPSRLRPSRPGRASALALVVAALAGCGSRPTSAVLVPVISAADVGKSVTILAATTRKRSRDNPEVFTNGRSRTVNYEQYIISIPPNHVSGHIEWPSTTPGDPYTNFVVRSERPLDEAAFGRTVAARLSSSGIEGGSVLVFVHGYNTNYQEAVFRMAQLAVDGPLSPATVLFAWPSRGTLTGYVADRESSTFSRDYLERVLNDIARLPNVRRINLVAHSMGNWLAVETLRQAKLRGHSPFVDKLGEVALLSPDIDVDVFRTQLDVIGRLKRPIIIALSRDDLALAASQRIAGDVPRAGNVLIDNPTAKAEIERYSLKVVDLSEVKGGDSLGHSNFIQALPELERIADGGTNGQAGIAAPGIFVVDAAGEILSTPLRIGNALLGR